jgi:hypothetical protein
MEVIPHNGDEPEIRLFPTIADLRTHLGHAYTHGMYDPKTNTIYATWHSLPHELGHYKDFISGKMSYDPDGQLRNELLAVLFAWQKHPDLHSFLSHEKEFLEAFYYMLEREIIKFEKEFQKAAFSEIQEIANDLSKPEHPLYKKTKNLFKHYLEKSVTY